MFICITKVSEVIQLAVQPVVYKYLEVKIRAHIHFSIQSYYYTENLQ